MEGFGPRFMILLAVTAIVTAATPVGAEVYRRIASDGTVYFTNIQPNPSYQRAVSRKGARGLMQLMPETAAILGVRDSFDPRENIHAGARHLHGLMERFRYDLPLAIAAYNAGEKPVVAFRGIPPYPETREYVTRVLRLYGAPIAWE